MSKDLKKVRHELSDIYEKKILGSSASAKTLRKETVCHVRGSLWLEWSEAE